MPGVASWNGRWSGEGRNYSIVRSLSAAEAAKLDGKHWSYRWSDGWCALVSAKIVVGKVKKSDGFYGYDWMVDSILRDGVILADHERNKERAAVPS